MKLILLVVLIYFSISTNSWSKSNQNNIENFDKLFPFVINNIQYNKKMKTIKYRGGLITFDIPQNWIEEYEKDGGGTFYEDNPSSGTLRVNVLTVDNSGKDDIKSPEDLFLMKKQNAIDFKESFNQKGDKIFQYLNRTTENNIQISLYSFACIHKTEQMDYLIAIFTWTIETRYENDKNYILYLKMIQENISKIKFGR